MTTTKRSLMRAVCCLLTCAVLSSIPVFAVTEEYNWKFSSTSGNLPTGSGYKNDNEQNYYLTISGGNVSKKNVFGTRIRKASNNAAVSSYVLHTSKEKSAKYGYSSSVNTSTLYLMRGKKDTSSTSIFALKASGKVTY